MLAVSEGPAAGRMAIAAISGRTLILYRLIWAGAFASAIVAATGGQYLDWRSAVMAAEGHATLLAAIEVIRSVVLIAVAASLYRRRGSDPIAAMLSLALLLWAVTSTGSAAAVVGGTLPLVVLDRIRFLLFTVALMLFPGGRFDPAWTRIATVATMATFLLGIAAAFGLFATPVYIVPATLCVLLAIFAMCQRLKMLAPGVERQQIKWVALGLGAGLAIVVVSRLIALLPQDSMLVRPLFDLGTMVMALGLLVSLLRYRLYDAESAISRSAAYAVLTLILVAVFAGSEGLIEALSQKYFGGTSGALSGGLATGLAAAMIAPLHQHVGNWMERRFQRALVQLRQELPRLAADLRETADLDFLATTALARIGVALRCRRAALIVDGEAIGTLHVDRADVADWLAQQAVGEHFACEVRDRLFPVRFALAAEAVGTTGWLLLGARPDGTLYGSDEQEALAEIAPALASAIYIVRRRLSQSQNGERQVRRLAMQIAELTSRLEQLERQS